MDTLVIQDLPLGRLYLIMESDDYEPLSPAGFGVFQNFLCRLCTFRRFISCYPLNILLLGVLDDVHQLMSFFFNSPIPNTCIVLVTEMQELNEPLSSQIIVL